MSKDFQRDVWRIAYDAHATNDANIDAATKQAAAAIQELPEYSAWVERMVKSAIREVVRLAPGKYESEGPTMNRIAADCLRNETDKRFAITA
jgi:hypothetical protein